MPGERPHHLLLIPNYHTRLNIKEVIAGLILITVILNAILNFSESSRVNKVLPVDSKREQREKKIMNKISRVTQTTKL